MPDESFKLIARVARGPWLVLVILMWVTTAAIFAHLSMLDPLPRLRLAFAVGAAVSAYMMVATARLILARGALVFVHGRHLVDTLSLGRRWLIDDIEGVTLAPSSLFVGRDDQIVLTLKTGKIARLSALLSSDPAEEILGRLDTALRR